MTHSYSEIEGFEKSYKQYLKTIWYDDEGEDKAENFWIHETMFHGSYSRSSPINNYIRTTANLGSKFLKDGPSDIIKALKELGYRFGEFADGHTVCKDLKRMLGVNVYLIVQENKAIPCLFDIGILFNERWELIDHPTATEIPEGKFKLCGIEDLQESFEDELLVPDFHPLSLVDTSF